MNIKEFKALVEKAIKQSALDPVKAYLLEVQNRLPDKNDVNRIAGSPIGVSDSSWPVYKNQKMFHLFTLDLNDTEDLKKYFPMNTRAISLFISDIIHNEAFSPGNDQTKLLKLTDADVSTGCITAGPEYDEDFRSPEESTFAVHEILFPAEVFENFDCYDDLSQPIQDVLDNLEWTIAGGKPIWLQGKEHHDDVLVQFDELFVDINLGDGGVMYVYEDTAFWQCH